MKKFIESLTGGYATSAKVIDGALILSLPDAVTPVVWRMDLGSVKASALEVRAQDNGHYVLTLKTPREDVHDVAPFATRAQAVNALMAVSRALEQAHGHMRPAVAVSAAATGPQGDVILAAPPRRIMPRLSAGQWIGLILTALLLFGLYKISTNLGPRTMSLTAAPQSSAQGSNAVGVPLSADSFLQGRR